MVDLSIPQRAFRRLPVLLYLTVASAGNVFGSAPATLTSVDAVDTTPESCRMVLSIQGQTNRVESFGLDGGRFVFDLTPVVWEGPTHRVRPDCPGIREYSHGIRSYGAIIFHSSFHSDALRVTLIK